MVGLIKLKSPIGRSYNMDTQDVLNAKRVLRELGYYEEPEHGITRYPDTLLVRGIEGFQRDRGLRLDGVMKPGGETEAALQAASLENQADALRLQRMGRNGDTVLAHITPKEALMLKARGGSGTVNPATGLLEFSTKTDKKGTYTWRTQGDGKVRGAHAERNGKVFSWDDPPEGGHPGEAPNCRCWAEDTVDTKKRCEELTRLIKAMEINLNKAQEHFSKAAETYNAAQEAWNMKQAECDKEASSSLGNIGGSSIGGGLTGGWFGAARGGAEGAAASAEDIYNACINNSREKQAYEQAKQEKDSAGFWVTAYREDLKGYRDEYEQLGCEI